MEIRFTVKKNCRPVWVEGTKYAHVSAEAEEYSGCRDFLMDTAFLFLPGSVLQGNTGDGFGTPEHDSLRKSRISGQDTDAQDAWEHYWKPCILTDLSVISFSSLEEEERHALFTSLSGIMRPQTAAGFVQTFPPTLLKEKQKQDLYWFYAKMRDLDESLQEENFSLINRSCTVTTFDQRLSQLHAGIFRFLSANRSRGSTWMTFDGLHAGLCWQFTADGHTPPEKDLLAAALNYFSDEFYYCGDRAGFEADYCTEADILDGCKLLLANRPLFTRQLIFDGLLCEEQCTAVSGIVHDGNLSILSGGPGTGKTTCIAEILKQYPDRKVCLLAPTGQALQHMRQSLSRVIDQETIGGFCISTICKFLGYGMPQVLKQEVLRKAGDFTLCIIDEASMVDIFRFAELLAALNKSGCKIVLVGDVDQLPSIQAGNLLTDLIHIGVPVYYLTENHRSVKSIRDNAQAVLNADGKSPAFIEDANSRFIGADAFEEVCENVNLAASNVLLLSPYRKPYDKNGRMLYGSTVAVNTRIHNRRFSDHATYSHPHYCVGDKVVCLKNNYKQGYFNGEIGYVVRMEERALYVQLGNGEDARTVEVLDTNEIDYAYALTIHKVQGSEADDIYIYLPDSCGENGSGLLSRELLYTAITRAKNKVTVIGDKKTLAMAAGRSANARHTFLSLIGNAAIEQKADERRHG